MKSNNKVETKLRELMKNNQQNKPEILKITYLCA